MRYLLDTCTFLWAIGNSPEISKVAKSIIEKEENLFLSQVSLWEIAIKKSIGKLELKENTSELERYCIEGGICILPIENSYFDTIQTLSFIHGDPFDRLIIATAMENDLNIITSDNMIKKYSGIIVIW